MASAVEEFDMGGADNPVRAAQRRKGMALAGAPLRRKGGGQARRPQGSSSGGAVWGGEDGTVRADAPRKCGGASMCKAPPGGRWLSGAAMGGEATAIA